MDIPTFTSVSPELWGRPFWEFLDAIVATFPKENPSIDHRNAVYELMRSLCYLLPCPVCRKHYIDFLQNNNLDNALNSRKALLEFYFLLKKDVATRTNKNFTARKPEDLWTTITRRLKLTKPGPIPQVVFKTTSTSKTTNVSNAKPFRVPTRSYANLQARVKPKGCGCGGK